MAAIGRMDFDRWTYNQSSPSLGSSDTVGAIRWKPTELDGVVVMNIRLVSVMT